MSQNFDLLGDPIPDGWGKPGRPPHIATDRNRSKVIMLLALGWSNERIARSLSITPPTLRKVYFRELRVRDEARDRLLGSLFTRCWEGVQERNVGAIKEFQRMLERNDLLLGVPSVTRDKPKAEPKLGKKEQAQRDAQSPDTQTPLGDLIARRQAGQLMN
ncbi:MAG: hypothetical protein P4M09_22575 [Devosia sp.]|nr:hypothetical protein [Devosia sp.]